MKKRIWELANQVGIKSKKLLAIAQDQGIKVTSVLNILEEEEVQKLTDYVSHASSQTLEKWGEEETQPPALETQTEVRTEGSSTPSKTSQPTSLTPLTSEEKTTLGNNQKKEESMVVDKALASQQSGEPTLSQEAKEWQEKAAQKHTKLEETNRLSLPKIEEGRKAGEKARGEALAGEIVPLDAAKAPEPTKVVEKPKVEAAKSPEVVKAPEPTKVVEKPKVEAAKSLEAVKAPEPTKVAEKPKVEAAKSPEAVKAPEPTKVAEKPKVEAAKSPEAVKAPEPTKVAEKPKVEAAKIETSQGTEAEKKAQTKTHEKTAVDISKMSEDEANAERLKILEKFSLASLRAAEQAKKENTQQSFPSQHAQQHHSQRTPSSVANQQQRNHQKQKAQTKSWSSNQGSKIDTQNESFYKGENRTKTDTQSENKDRTDLTKGRSESSVPLVPKVSGLEKEKLAPLISEKKTSSKEISASQPRAIEVPVPITIKDLSHLTGIRANSIIQKLANSNVQIQPNLNQILDASMVELVALEFNKDLKIKKEENQEEMLLKELEKEDAPQDLVPRAPVVTFMGHVDHGKTSLLDCIRKTSVAAGEAGGITQHIGASKIDYNKQSIVFLDTPGHEAFTAMRARGANVTDIVVLVVAADDGVMPQTVEAINHAKAAKVPILVAINKMDKPGARPDVVMQQLARHNLIPEKWHGDTICVEVSALTKQGINTLLDYLLLIAEMLELKANPKRKASGTVLDARIVEGKGEVATLLVQNGTLNQGDTILCGKHYGRIREIAVKDILTGNYSKVKQAGPSTPVDVCGLSGLPEAGDKFCVLDSLSNARNMAETRQKNIREQSLAHNTRRLTIEEIMKELQEGATKELRVILKCDVQGSLEALSVKVQEIVHEEIKVKLLHAAVGGINERDIQLADASRALIVGFNVAANKAARDMADEKKIEVRRYNVIYHVLEDLKKIMTGMLAPKISEEVAGHASVRKIIHISKIGNVAGCYVTDGAIERNSKIKIYRNGIVLNKEKFLEIGALKRFKEDVGKVKEGFECGIRLENFEDIKEGDELEAIRIIKTERSFD